MSASRMADVPSTGGPPAFQFGALGGQVSISLALDHTETMLFDEQVSGIGTEPDPALLLTIGC